MLPIRMFFTDSARKNAYKAKSHYSNKHAAQAIRMLGSVDPFMLIDSMSLIRRSRSSG